MKICQPIRDSFARALLLVGLGMAVLILSPVAHGQTDIYLKNGVLDPTIAANWTLIGGANATVVNASDLGIINSTVTGVENLTTFAGSLTLGGLEITNPGGAVSLSPSSATTFNLGSSALLSSPTYFSALPFSTIDLSNSSVSLTLGANLNTVLTSGQNWYVGNGTSTPTLTVSGTLALGTNQLYMVGTGNYDITGAISGSGQLVVDTNGTTTLSGLNTNSGGVVLGNGTLVITNNGTGSASSLGTGNFSIGTDYLSGTGNISTNNTSVILGTNNQILLGGNLNFAAGAGANLNFGTGAVILLGNETANISGNSVTINGNIVDGGAATSDGYGLTKTGTGTLVLGGSNSTFTGNLNLTAGVLSINNSLALQNAILNITGGSFTGNVSSVTLGGLAGNQIINIGADAFTIDTVYGHNATYTGNIADSSNAATVSINGAAIQAFSGNNMINGTVTLNSGTLGINNGGNATSSAIGTGTLVIAGGSLDNTSGSAVTLATNNAQTWNNSYSFAGTNNLNMGTGAVTLNEAATTVTVNSGILTEGGNISGTGDSITKAGTYGTLTLTGNNTYTGGTTVSAGTLIIDDTTAAANNFGAGTFTVNSGGILTLSTSDTITGNTTLNSGGVLNFNNAGAISGGSLVINGGTLDNTSGGNIASTSNNAQYWNGDFTYAGTGNLNLGTGAVAMNASRTLTVNTNTLTIGGAISGSTFSLTQSGNGTLVLNGANSYSGGTIINSGTVVLAGTNTGAGSTTVNNGGQLDLNNAAGLGTGSLLLGNVTTGSVTLDNTSGSAITTSTHNNTSTVNGTVNFIGSNALTLGTGAVTLASNATFNVEASSLTVGGTISGGASLTKNGTGDLVLTGTNSYSGVTDINGGTLTVSVIAAGGSNSGIGSSSNAATNLVIANNATLQYVGTSAATTDRLFTIGNNTATIDASGSLAADTLTFSNTSAINFSPTGTSNSTGGNASYVDGNVDETLILTGNNTGLNTFKPALGDNNGGTHVDPASLIKNGTGEWVLAGSNTYTGQTILNTGTLSLTNNTSSSASSLGLSTLVINGGALDNTGAAALTLTTNNAQQWNNSFGFVGTQALNMGTGGVTLNNGTTPVTITTTASTLTIGGVISDNGLGYSLTKAGAGGTLVLSGANTFSGNMNVTAGTLNVGSNTSLQNAILNYTGGTVTWGNTTANNLGGLAGTLSILSQAITLNLSHNQVSSTSGVLSGTSSLTISGVGTQTFSGIQTYTHGTTLNSGTLVLSGANTFGVGCITVNGGSLSMTAANSYSGGTTVNGGTLVLSGANTMTGTTTLAGGTLDFNNATAIGTSTLTITGGKLDNTSAGAIVNTKNNAQNWNGNFTFGGSQSLNLGTGAVTMNNNRTLTISANTLTIGGIISGATFGLTLNGAGTLDLGGASASTYTGATTVNGGTLIEDFSLDGTANATNLLSTSSNLTLGGGTFEVKGQATAGRTDSQTFGANTTFNSGASAITMAPNSENTANALTLTLGATLSANMGGTLNITNPNFTDVKTSNTTLTGNVFTNVTGGFAYMTVNGTDWAGETGGVIGATTYTGTNANTTWIVGNNVKVTGALTGTAFGTTTTINSLNFEGASNVTFNTGSMLMVKTGGILDSGATADTITGGTIEGSASGALVVIQNSTGNLTIGSTIANNTSTTGLTKSGTGELIISGANTYNGTTTLNQGTLALNNNNAIGTGTGTQIGGLVINGGTLDNTSGSNITTTNNVQTWNNSFGFAGSGNLNLGTGAVTLGQNVTVTTAGAANNLTVGGIIGGTGLGLTVGGTGNLVLSGANNYTGGTTVTGGTLDLTGAGSYVAGTFNVSGGTLMLNNANTITGNTNLNSGTLDINNAGAIGTGTLVINGGTIDNTSGAAITTSTNNNAQQWNGNYTFAGSNGANSNLNLGTGAVALGQNETVTTTNAASTLTVGGVISGGYSLTKAGSGDLVLSGANTYTGGTVVSTGTLEANNNNALGTGSIFNSVSVSSGASLQLDAGFDSGSSGSSNGSLLTISGAGAGTGTAAGALVANGSGTTEWNGNIVVASGGATIGAGAGSATNSTLYLGNTSIVNFATLAPASTNISLGSNTLTFSGGMNTTVEVYFGSITGTGGINVNMTSNATNSAYNGRVDYAVIGNTYTGTTTVTNGTLNIDSVANTVPESTSNGNTTAINGPLVIGTGVNASGNTAIVQIGAYNSGTLTNDQVTMPMSTTTNVTINSDGELYLSGGGTQQITNLTMNNGGFIQTQDQITPTTYGLLTILGTATVAGNGTSTAYMNGNINMSNSVGNQTTVWNVTGGSTTSDLTINALLSGGSLIKTGSGTMTLTNQNNSYTGTTEIAAGTLAITASTNTTSSNSPLGASNSNSLAYGTTVDSGGQLQLQNGITISGETLTLNGNGTNNNGALMNQSGNSTWNGTIYVGANSSTVPGASNATINTAAGNLTLAGTVTTTTSTSSTSSMPTLTILGNNTSTTISGVVSGALNLNLTANGSNTNTVVMSGSSVNTYTGNTIVNANTTLVLDRTGATNNSVAAGTITINQGGTLLSDTTQQINSNANMNLNGGTWQTAATGAFAEQLGSLTLSMSSNITLGNVSTSGTTSNNITFAASNGNTWTPGAVLYINDWNGTFATSYSGQFASNGGNGTDIISFSTSSGVLGNSYDGQMGDIIFVNPQWNGVQYTGDYNAVIESTGEVVPFLPAPEPGTVAAGASLAALAILREWRKRKDRAKTTQITTA